MSDNPTFNSPDLQVAYSQTKKHIESLRTNLDLISRDIKELEEMLDRNGVRISVRGRLPKLDGSSSRVSIHWEEYSVSSKWRLVYVETHLDPQYGFQTAEDTKPLIEMKASIRIAVYDYLPNFLRMIAKTVKVEPLSERVDLTDESLFGPDASASDASVNEEL